MRRRWSRPVRAGLLLGFTALVVSSCSAHDAEKKLRFGWPTGVTKQGTEMRVLWTWAGVAALVVGVMVWGLIFWACLRHRAPKDDPTFIPKQFKANLTVEVIGVILPLFVIAGLFYRTVVVEDDANKLTKHPAVVIQADGFKWNWQFEYHTYNGQPTAYPGVQNPADAKKPYYVSTVGSNNEIPVLVIPVNQTVQVIEHSDDVIHSFWVPEFLFKRDVIPYGSLSTDHDNRFEFTATSTGSFVGRCAELCGTYHSQMNFEVRVVQPDVYKAYLAALEQIGPTDPDRQSKALQQAHVPGGPYATTTKPFRTDRTQRSAGN